MHADIIQENNLTHTKQPKQSEWTQLDEAKSGRHCLIGTKPLSVTVFEIFGPKTPTHIHRHMPQVILYCPMQRIALDKQLNTPGLTSSYGIQPGTGSNNGPWPISRPNVKVVNLFTKPAALKNRHKTVSRRRHSAPSYGSMLVWINDRDDTRTASRQL